MTKVYHIKELKKKFYKKVVFSSLQGLYTTQILLDYSKLKELGFNWEQVFEKLLPSFNTITTNPSITTCFLQFEIRLIEISLMQLINLSASMVFYNLVVNVTFSFYLSFIFFYFTFHLCVIVILIHFSSSKAGAVTRQVWSCCMFPSLMSLILI